MSPITTSLVQPMDKRIKNLESLYPAKLVNYNLEATQENLISSTAKEASASIDLLEAAQFIVYSWRTVNTSTIQNCFAHSGFKHSGLEMPNKDDCDNDVTM
jgi:hypothetical protein